jgi:hypothetical protein
MSGAVGPVAVGEEEEPVVPLARRARDGEVRAGDLADVDLDGLIGGGGARQAEGRRPDEDGCKRRGDRPDLAWGTFLPPPVRRGESLLA